MSFLRTGLLGNPVKHSMSPLVHRVFMDGFGICGEYSLFKAYGAELGGIISRLSSAGFAGLNITVPHKKRVLEFCGTISPDAESIGAVNTLVFRGENVEGHNTDIAGFSSFSSELPLPFYVLGRGGAAMAVAAGVSGRDLMFLGREESIPADRLHKISTVINATPLGWCDDDEFPFDIPEGWFFADLNYNPGWKWRNELWNRGVKVITGEGMLVEQAACSFALWTGYTPDMQMKIRALERIKAEFYAGYRPAVD